MERLSSLLFYDIALLSYKHLLMNDHLLCFLKVDSSIFPCLGVELP